MLKLIGEPPDKVQFNVADWPLTMLVGVAVKLEIIGAGGFTVIVTDFVAVPEIFEAVKT